MLDMEMCLDSLWMRIVKLALNAGSSKQGKAARAWVASNWVDANILQNKSTSCLQWSCKYLLDLLPIRSYVLPDLSTACGVRAFIKPMKTVRQVGRKLQLHNMASPCECKTVREEGYLFVGFKLTDLKIQRTSGGQEQSSGDVKPFAVENESSGVLFDI